MTFPLMDTGCLGEILKQFQQFDSWCVFEMRETL